MIDSGVPVKFKVKNVYRPNFGPRSLKKGWLFLGKDHVLFWEFTRSAFKQWGTRPPSPFLPFLYRLFFGPVCFSKVTLEKPRVLSRQERRYLERMGKKRRAQMIRHMGGRIR